MMRRIFFPSGLGIGLGIFAAIGLFLNFLMQAYIFFKLRPGVQSDAWLAAQTIPIFMLSIISPVITKLIVSALKNIHSAERKKLIIYLLILVSITFFAVDLILRFSSEIIMEAIFSGFDHERVSLSVRLMAISQTTVIFFVWSSILVAYYQCENKFITVESISIFTGGLSFIALYFFIEKHGAFAAAYISVFRSILNFLILGYGILSVSDLNKKIFNSEIVKNGNQVFLKYKPIFFGSLFFKTAPLLDKYFASHANTGEFTIFVFSQTLISSAMQVMDKSIISIFLNKLIGLMSENKINEFKAAYRIECIKIALYICFFYALFLIFEKIIGINLIKFFDFNQVQYDLLVKNILYLFGMLLGGGMGMIANSAFYALGETVVSTKVGVYGYIAAILLKGIFFYKFGLVGLVLATSIYYLLNAAMLILVLEIKIYGTKKVQN